MFSLDQLEAGENSHQADSRPAVQSSASCSRSRGCCVFVLLRLKLVPLSPSDFQTLWENQVSFGCCAMFPCGVCLPRGSIAGARHGSARHRGVLLALPGRGMQPCRPVPSAPWGAWLLPRGFLLASHRLTFWLFSHLSLSSIIGTVETDGFTVSSTEGEMFWQWEAAGMAL